MTDDPRILSRLDDLCHLTYLQIAAIHAANEMVNDATRAKLVGEILDAAEKYRHGDAT